MTAAETNNTTASISLMRGAPPQLEDHLASRIRQAQADDPLTPVAVVIGGTLQRPYLQRRLAELNDGIVNVHFLMPGEFALRLGEGAMRAAGKKPLPALGDRILLREVASQHEGYFEPVRDTGGLADALHQLVRELRGSSFTAEDFQKAASVACEVPAKAQALSAIYRSFLDKRSGFFGADDCLLGPETSSSPWASIWIYGPWDLPPAFRRLLKRLSNEVPVELLVPATGAVADGVTAPLREWSGNEGNVISSGTEHTTALDHLRAKLFRASDGSREVPDDSLTIVSAPDPQREVREIARTVLAWARAGVRFHDMAIAYRHPEPYRSLVELVFREAGIPVYLHEGTPLSERPLGRQAITLLELAGGNLERQAVMDFLSEARFPDSTHKRYNGIPATRWDLLSRRAGVVEGLDQWTERLEALAEELEQSDREWEQKQAAQARELIQFMVDLAAALESLPEHGTWAEQLAALSTLFETYVHGAEPLLAPLAGLTRFDALSGTVSRERFAEFIAGAIENMRSDEVLGGPPGAFGRRGVNVLDVNSLRHIRFKAVAVVGVSERSFPPPPRPDPLLLDDEREELNKHHTEPIPLRVRRPDAEPLQFMMATWAAREALTISYPRKGESGGTQLPSYFVRAALEAVTGEPVSADDVDRVDTGHIRRVAGSAIGASDPAGALSLSERDRTVVEQAPALGRKLLAAIEPRVARGFGASAARANRQLTPFDGAISSENQELLAKLFKDQIHAPTGLQNYATCPQRYFLRSVLGLRAFEEPEALVRISALDKGSVIHRIFERFLGEPPAKGEDLLVGNGERDRLMAVTEEECEHLESMGRTGFPLMWSYDRGEIRNDVLAWLDREIEDSWTRRFPNGEYEVRFGPWGKKGSGAGRLSRDEPIEIDADGAKLKVGGFIDRLNWGDDGFRVIDYKTGSAYKVPKDGSLKGGQALQLPIYLLAAAELLEMDPSSGSAEYHYVTRIGESQRSIFSGEHVKDRKQDLDAVLGGIIGGIHEGNFQMAPEDSWGCQYCDYDSICPMGRESMIDRKRDDKRAKPLTKLREID